MQSVLKSVRKENVKADSVDVLVKDDQVLESPSTLKRHIEDDDENSENVEKPKQKALKMFENDLNGNQENVMSKHKANPCKVCNESFDTMDELIMHAKIEHSTRKTKMFPPEDIEYFLKVFSKLKRNHCPICHKAILNTLNWRVHMEKHSLVKDITCKVCGKGFSREDHRKNHEKRHTIAAPESDEDTSE